MDRISDYLSQEELLAQVAEEAAELAQAALKLRRVLNGNSPTPVQYSDAVDQLNEEMADVMLCTDQLHFLDMEKIKQIYAAKEKRWLERMQRRKDNARKSKRDAG